LFIVPTLPTTTIMNDCSNNKKEIHAVAVDWNVKKVS
jgi:hypothetical protein